jgi:hypothetical protein
MLVPFIFGGGGSEAVVRGSDVGFVDELWIAVAGCDREAAYT